VKDDKGGILSEIRDHFIEIYNKVGVGLLRRHVYYEERFQKQELEWSAACDKLIEDHQQMKEDKERSEEKQKERIYALESQLNEMKIEHYSLINDNKDKAEKLNKELQNSINSHYLKNILISYLTTSDPSV